MDNKSFVNVLDRIYNSLIDFTNFDKELRDIASKVVFFPADLTSDDVAKFSSIIEHLYREHIDHVTLCNSVHDLMVSIRDYDL